MYSLDWANGEGDEDWVTAREPMEEGWPQRDQKDMEEGRDRTMEADKQIQ
jgi:hypothetical protein